MPNNRIQGLRILNWSALYYLNFMLLISAVLAFFDINLSILFLIIFQVLYWKWLVKSGRASFLAFNALLAFYVDFTLLAKYGPFDIYLLESVRSEVFFSQAYSLTILSLFIVNIFNIPQTSCGVELSRKGCCSDNNAKRFSIYTLVSLYLPVTVALGLYGFYLYGGYLSYLSTPYDPVFEGMSENDYKHVIVATAGLASVLLYALALGLQRLSKKSMYIGVIKLVPIFFVLSFFVQGKREYLVELIVVGLLFRLAIPGHNVISSHVFKIILGLLGLPLLLGFGLYLRGDVSITDFSSILQLPVLALAYEAEFTFATIANVILVQDIYSVGYDYFKFAFDILLYVVPRDLFSLFGVNKDDLFLVSKFAKVYVENKGGAFYLVAPFVAAGYIGVVVFSAVLGAVFLFVEKVGRGGVVGSIFYSLFVMSLLVLVRKDFALWFKYLYVIIFQPLILYFFIKETMRLLGNHSVYRCLKEA